ncbi:acetyl-CoA carboxylase biotin carboxylase subunit family protein [uncultured Clostridium sp.]|uniref:ATP-grasp domain-containing protein n=1 Tax=uncultured Clostridium sp. TaxID=59620 RepID=UPI0025E0CC0F|nr:ATP-grasp domain-containing protein [uncultured Clostridium sp.]
MEYVISIGASDEHIESINIAKKMGYKVIAVDGNKYSEGFKYSDISINVDIKNEEEIIKIAQAYDVKAVLPAPIGKLLTTVGAVNDALKLTGISKEAALNCVDKVRFNRCLSKINIPCARQLTAESKDEIIDSVKKIGLPCILKPRFGSGSNGIIVIERPEEILDCINKHYNERGNDVTLVEELLPGKEYGVDGVIKGGKVDIVLVREKVMTALPYRQETEYICPADIDLELEFKIRKIIENVCKATNINNCLINADILIDNNVVYIIEMAGRPAGYFISRKIIPEVTGVNFLFEGINMAINKECDFRVKQKNILIVDFLDYVKGKILEFPTNEQLEKLEFIHESNLHFKCGDVVKRITCGKDIYNRGYVIIKVNNYNDIGYIKQKIKKMIKVD